MSRVLVVSSATKGAEVLSSLARQAEGFADITVSASGGEARRYILDYEYDLILVNAPLTDEDGEALSQMVVEETLSPVIMIVGGPYFNDIQTKMEEDGILVLQKPIIREVFVQMVGIAHSLRRRLQGMQVEQDRLQKRIDEIKLVDRAKWALMTSLGMEEEQAHHYIEKQAMDQRKSRIEIANGILRTYR